MTEPVKPPDNFDPSTATELSKKEDIIKKMEGTIQKLLKVISNNSKDKRWLVSTAGVILLGIAVIAGIVIYVTKKSENSFEQNYRKSQQIRIDNDRFSTFEYKAIDARQVFAFNLWKKYDSPFGRLNLSQHFAMGLRPFSKMLDMMWEFNEYIGCGENEQFFILSQLIFESALNEAAKHLTGEIVKFAGYTREGLMYALWVYKDEMRIDSGSPFYIPELYQRHPNYEAIFSKWENVLKFHYAFMWWKKRKYSGRWDFILTSYNQGEPRVDAWGLKGLDRVPNELLSKKHKLWLREYYQTIFEIRSAIASGNLQRMSKTEKHMKKVARKMTAYRKDKIRYIKTVRLKFKEADKYRDLKESFDLTKKEFDDYKKLVDKYMDKMAEVNDVQYKVNIKKMKTKYGTVLKKLKAEALEILHEIERLKKKNKTELILRISFIGVGCIFIILILIILIRKAHKVVREAIKKLGGKK